MATLTLGKSVTTDAVRSKKGDAVFVERRRRVVAPGNKELRDEPNTPATQKNAADEKLRAVLAAAKAREEERRQREAAEEAARAARAADRDAAAEGPRFFEDDAGTGAEEYPSRGKDGSPAGSTAPHGGLREGGL